MIEVGDRVVVRNEIIGPATDAMIRLGGKEFVVTHISGKSIFLDGASPFVWHERNLIKVETSDINFDDIDIFLEVRNEYENDK